MERVVAGVCLTIAFIVMASIISPGGSHAEGTDGPHHGAAHPIGASSNAHAGLPSLGVIEDGDYRIEIYATSEGPRYSLFELESGEEVGTLLSLEKVTEWFPDLHLPEMNRQDGTGPIMMADPPYAAWPE